MARVLVVEDEAFTALALVDVLEARGHTVQDAPDGAAAIGMLASFEPDVVVTDLMMPNLDGAGLIAHLRAGLGPPVPVVLITGVPESKLPRTLGHNAYLGKPIDHDCLGLVVEALCQQTLD